MPREAACRCGDMIGQGSLSLGVVPTCRLASRGVRTARAAPRGEQSQGASVCARGGIHPGWWPPWAFRGVTARRVPERLWDVLGPRTPVASGVSLVAW